MKKILLMAPKASVIGKFNTANILALKELGYVIMCMSNFSDDIYSDNVKKELDSNCIYTFDLPFVRASLKSNVKLVPTIKKILKNENFDVVHCQTETGGILIRMSKCALPSARYIYTPHGMSFYKGSSIFSQLVYKPIEKWICQGMDQNIGINLEEVEVLKKWDKNKTFYTHGIGVNVSDIANTTIDIKKKKTELNIPEGNKIVLSIGELNSNKNHITILKAIALLPEKQRPIYLICGEGPNREYLLREAKRLRIENILFMPGFRNDINEILKISDIFAFPSYHEGLSVSLMQAMASSLPIVCSRIRGNVDLVVENEGGYLCKPDDVNDFSEKISFLLDNNDVCIKYGIFNKNYVEDFSLERVKTELINIYANSR